MPDAPADPGTQDPKPNEGEGTTPPEGGQPAEKPADKPLGEGGERALAEERRARKAAEKRIAELERSKLSDDEKAIADAREDGRKAAASEFGTRLARSSFTAAAAARNAGFKVADLFEYVDLAKFVGDDGEPDEKAIEAAVKRLIPESQAVPPDFEPGTRTPSPKAPSMNDMIRKAAGRS